jgi:hypothetical protein
VDGGQKTLEGSTDAFDDEFTYRYKDVHDCKMKPIEVSPYEKGPKSQFAKLPDSVSDFVQTR